MSLGAGPQTLRDLMAAGMVSAPGVCDAFTARLVERAGFQALYLGGNALGLSYAKGQPFITLTETVDTAARIARTSDLPLIVDSGAGFGAAAHVHRAVREIESVGAAALHIDDQPYPKSPGYHRGRGGLAPVETAAARIRIAAEARRDPKFMIVARTDAYRVERSIEAAIERGRAYAAAGADALMVLDLEPAGAAELRAALPGMPLVWIGAVAPPVPTRTQLQEAGFALAVYPINTIAAIADAVSSLWAAVRETGVVPQDGAFLIRWRRELSEIAGLPAYWDMEDALRAEHP